MFELISIIVPVALQKIIAASNPLLDNFMIGKLGTAAVAALGSANKFMGMMRLLLIGISTANGILTSQFNSNKSDNRRDGFTKTLALNIILSLSASLIFLTIFLLFKTRIISSFSPDILVQKLASDYLSIGIYSVIPLSILFSLSSSLRSMKKIYLLLFITITFILINFFLNNVLIYGNCGFKAMGVKGAALATLISEICAIFMIVIGIIIFKYPYKLYFKISSNFIKRYLKIALPLSITWLLWSLFLVLVHNLIGGLGREELAAYGIISPIEVFVSNIFAGFGSATLILVGKKLGSNSFDKAYLEAKKISIIGVIFSILMSIILYLNAESIANLYKGKISIVAIKYVIQMIRLYSLFLFARVFNSISYNGIFASGGDSKFIFTMSISIFLILTLPTIYIGVNYYNFQIMNIYLLMNLAEVLTSLIFFKRFLSKKWMNNLIED